MKSLFLFTLLMTVLAAPVIYAQTADGENPDQEDACALESGAAFGLCNAYCEAMDCELLGDGDPNTNPNASATACNKVKDKYIQLSGNAALPCDLPCEDVQLSYFYSYSSQSGTTTLCDNGIFTIYNSTGGCGPPDIAQCETINGQLRAINDDSCADPVLGNLVTTGCSTAVWSSYTVECCVQ